MLLSPFGTRKEVQEHETLPQYTRYAYFCAYWDYKLGTMGRFAGL